MIRHKIHAEVLERDYGRFCEELKERNFDTFFKIGSVQHGDRETGLIIYFVEIKVPCPEDVILFRLFFNENYSYELKLNENNQWEALNFRKSHFMA